MSEENEESIRTQLEGMNENEKRIFKLKMRLNQGRKANKAAVEQEYQSFTGGRVNEAKDKEYSQYDPQNDINEKDRLNKLGLGKGEEILLESASNSLKLKEKMERKRHHEETFGYGALTCASDYHSYEKKLKKMPTAAAVKAEQEELLRTGAAISSAGLDRLARDIEEREEKKLKQSGRRHRNDGGVASNAINDKNAFFNKKIKRSFDKYTVDIRQSLERGTAV